MNKKPVCVCVVLRSKNKQKTQRLFDEFSYSFNQHIKHIKQIFVYICFIDHTFNNFEQVRCLRACV